MSNEKNIILKKACQKYLNSCFGLHNQVSSFLSCFIYSFHCATVKTTHYLPPALCGVGDLVRCDSQVRQDLSDSSGVHTTVRSYIALTPSVHIHLTHCVTTKAHENGSRLMTPDSKSSNTALEGHRCHQVSALQKTYLL